MASVHSLHQEHETMTSIKVMARGSIVEVIGGATALVLGILGLARVLPVIMVAVATIAAGVALLFEGGSIASRYAELLDETGGGVRAAASLSSGMTSESLGGVAGIVLGVLALVGVAPIPLMGIAAIVLGGALLLGSGSTARLNMLTVHRESGDAWQIQLAREAVAAAAGTQILVGAGSVVLGILALQGMSPQTMILVAMLSLGGSVLLSGTTLGGRMLSAIRG